jgi:hypothetical protein
LSFDKYFHALATELNKEYRAIVAASASQDRGPSHCRVGEVQSHAAGARFGDKATLELTIESELEGLIQDTLTMHLLAARAAQNSQH